MYSMPLMVLIALLSNVNNIFIILDICITYQTIDA